jgi:hypothetical protein
MRSLAFVLIAPLAGTLAGTLVGCGGSSESSSDPPDAPTTETGFQPPVHGFQIVSPTIDVDPRAEITFCYYFRTSNTSPLSIQKWASRMTPGVHHMIVYLTPEKLREPYTFATEKCGLAAIGVGPVWAYAAQDADQEAVLPPDDGSGHPVGQPIQAGQYGFLQITYRNATDTKVPAHVELNAYAYDDGIQVTPAGSFVTLNTQIDLAPAPSPAMPTTGMVRDSCNVSSDAKFFAMTTFTHKQGVHTFVQDGAMTLFDSVSWEHPGTQSWSMPFFSFASGKLFNQCEYVNPNGYTIQYGDDTAKQEMCMAIGFFFPSPEGTGHFCVDSFVLN